MAAPSVRVRWCSGGSVIASPSVRPITSRWISDVPSKIVYSLASRYHFSTGRSRIYPQPPATLIACSVIRTATSDAFSFDIEPSAWW